MNLKGPKWKSAIMEKSSIEHITDMPLNEVFALCCPVMEYEWIRGWSCTMRHSISGKAEMHAVFQSRYPWPFGMKATWICTRYEKDKALMYTAFVPNTLIVTLEDTFEVRADGKTRLKVDFTGIGLSWLGKKIVKRMFAKGGPQSDDLDYYLKHRKMKPGKQ